MSVAGVTIGWSVGTFGADEELDAASGGAVLRSLSLAFERASIEAGKWGTYLFPNVIDALEENAREQFDAEGKGAVVGRWNWLTQNYARWKERHWPGQPILVMTGALRAALTTSGASGALRETTPTTLSYGTRGIEYASYHQTGAPKSNLAARPPVDFDDAAAERLGNAARTALRELISVARLDALLEAPIGPATETAASLGPMTKAQASAAKGKATRIEKLKALRLKREGR